MQGFPSLSHPGPTNTYGQGTTQPQKLELVLLPRWAVEDHFRYDSGTQSESELDMLIESYMLQSFSSELEQIERGGNQWEAPLVDAILNWLENNPNSNAWLLLLSYVNEKSEYIQGSGVSQLYKFLEGKLCSDKLWLPERESLGNSALRNNRDLLDRLFLYRLLENIAKISNTYADMKIDFMRQIINWLESYDSSNVKYALLEGIAKDPKYLEEQDIQEYVQAIGKTELSLETFPDSAEPRMFGMLLQSINEIPDEYHDVKESLLSQLSEWTFLNGSESNRQTLQGFFDNLQ